MEIQKNDGYDFCRIENNYPIKLLSNKTKLYFKNSQNTDNNNAKNNKYH